MNHIADSADKYIETVNYATSMLLIDEEVLLSMRTLYSSVDDYARYKAKINLIKELGSLESSIMNAVNGKIAILTADNQYISFSHISSTRNTYQHEKWYTSTLDNGRGITYSPEIGNLFMENITSKNIQQHNYLYLHYARTIRNYSGENYGVVACQLSTDKLWGDYLNQHFFDSNVEMYIISTEGTLQALNGDVAVRRYESISDLPALLQMKKWEHMDGIVNGYYYYAVRLNSSPNIMLMMQSKVDLFGTDIKLMLILWISAFGVIVLILIFFSNISQKISRPLTELARTMDENHESIIPLQSQNTHFYELYEFINSYNRACARVDELMEEVRMETQLRERTHYEMLISQISPHFICNTVNSIKYMAALADAPMVEEALVALGDILQSVYSNDSGLTYIAKEIQLLSSYVKIMRIRFGFKFQYTENIPAELYMCEIPAFTLQPLVENAILHGVRDKSAGQIIINAEADDTTIRIAVFNNGRVDLEKVERSINKSSHNKSQFTGIGLYNIQSRLQILYGGNYGLTPNKQLEGGLEIIITIPRKVAQLHDQSTNN